MKVLRYRSGSYNESSILAHFGDCKVEITIPSRGRYNLCFFIKKQEKSSCINEEKKYLCARSDKNTTSFIIILLKQVEL
jgi:hypothetical protein